MRKASIALAVVAVLGAVLYYSGFTESFVENFAWSFAGHAGIPSCKSSHGRSDAKRAIENSPVAKTSGITVEAVMEVKQISANAQKVECTAMAILNTAEKGVINYSFAIDPSLSSRQYYIQAALDLPSFKPYP